MIKAMSSKKSQVLYGKNGLLPIPEQKRHRDPEYRRPVY